MTSSAALGLRRACRTNCGLVPRALATALLVALLCLPPVSRSPCLAETHTETPAASNLGLAELVPKARELSEKKAGLEDRMAKITALDGVEESLRGLEERYADTAAALQSLEASGEYTLDQLTRLKAGLRHDAAAIDAHVADLKGRLEEIESERKQWSELGGRWREGEAAVPAGEMGRTVRTTFDEARVAVAGASSLVAQAAPKVVRVQREAVDLQARFQELSKEVEGLADEIKKGGLLGLRSPPMLTRRFAEQFSKSLQAALAGNLGEPAGLRARGSSDWGWLVSLHVLLAVIFGFVLRYSRVEGPVREKWKALLERPYAAGTLAGVLLPAAFYVATDKLPPIVDYALSLAGGVAALRVGPRLLTSRPLRRTLAPLVWVFLTDRLLRMLGVSMPLLRGFSALLAAVGAPLCFWWAQRKSGAPRGFAFGCVAAGVLLGFACIAQVSGHSSLGFLLVEGLLMSIFLLLLGWMFSLLLRGSAELLLERAILARWTSLRSRGGEILRTWGTVTDGVTLCLFASLLLLVWRVVDTPVEGLHLLLGLGFDWRGQRFSLGLGLFALALLYLSLTASGIVQAVLEGEVYPQRRVGPGARISINRLIHYAFVFVGLLLAFNALGLELGRIVVLAGALGVGIGFGLQNIVNNFVSGVILLFERPVEVGDVLQLGAEWGKVIELGLRATTIETFDRSEIIVPNSELIAGRVVNWTHSDRTARILLSVGVAYGSDVAGVMEILEEAAAAHPEVVREPKPEAFFVQFGESSLDFQLRAWVSNIDDRSRVQSQLLQAIDLRFREAGIEIPFPQRVVHLPKQERRTRDR